MNVRISYMYRDAGNYKSRSYAIFANTKRLDITAIRERLDSAAEKWRLYTGEIHFRPECVGLPTCYFTDVGYAPNGDDFELHEVEAIEASSDTPTDNRSIGEFLNDVERAEAWPAFSLRRIG